MVDGPIVVIGMDPPEQERIHEIVCYYADHRAASPSAIFGQGYEVRLDEGDAVTTGGDGGYVIMRAPDKVMGERVVRVPPGYLWVEERVYTREKKPIKPKVKPKES